jgi:hypothetical protein
LASVFILSTTDPSRLKEVLVVKVRLSLI